MLFYNKNLQEITSYHESLQALKSSKELKQLLDRVTKEAQYFKANNSNHEADNINERYAQLISKICSEYKSALQKERHKLIYQILAEAKKEAEKEFIGDCKAVEDIIKKDGGTQLKKLLDPYRNSLLINYNENYYWNIADETSLMDKIRIALEDQEITNTSHKFEIETDINNNLITLISMQFRNARMIEYLKEKLPLMPPFTNSPSLAKNPYDYLALQSMCFDELFKKIVNVFVIIDNFINGRLTQYEYQGLHDLITLLIDKLKEPEYDYHHNYYKIHRLERHLANLDQAVFEGDYKTKINIWESVPFYQEISELRLFLMAESFEFPKHPGPPTYAQEVLNFDTLAELRKQVVYTNPSKRNNEDPLPDKPVAWHYAIALALLQNAGCLKSTFGKKGATIEQAEEYFKVDEKLASNIYDGIKIMIYPRDAKKWNINYALENHITKKRIHYKLIVKNLLGDNPDAISLLNELID